MDKWCPVCGNPVDITSGNAVFACTHPTGAHKLTYNVYGVMVQYEAPVEVIPEPLAPQEQPKLDNSEDQSTPKAKAKVAG